MKHLFLSGKIHPERAILSFSNVEQELHGADSKRCRIKFNAYCNQITALIESEDEEDIYTLRNIVKASVELVTNVVGFLKGYAYDVEITKIFDAELDLSRVFGIEIPALEERNKTADVQALNHIYPLCLGSDGVYLRRSLSDLGMAIRHADDTPFYCFRALESLKQYFGFMSGKESDGEQWQEMARALGDHRTVVDPIRKLAFPARHGVPEILSDDERKRIFFVAWEVVEKFINYRLEQSGSNYRFQPTQNASGILRG